MPALSPESERSCFICEGYRFCVFLRFFYWILEHSNDLLAEVILIRLLLKILHRHVYLTYWVLAGCTNSDLVPTETVIAPSSLSLGE